MSGIYALSPRQWFGQGLMNQHIPIYSSRRWLRKSWRVPVGCLENRKSTSLHQKRATRSVLDTLTLWKGGLPGDAGISLNNDCALFFQKWVCSSRPLQRILIVGTDRPKIELGACGGFFLPGKTPLIYIYTYTYIYIYGPPQGPPLT